MRRQTTTPVHVVDNGVDLDSFSPAGSYEQLSLLYLGSLDWRPNVDAIEHLVQEVWPLIRQACPAARLEVVGRRASAGLRALLAGADGVMLHSDVADVRPMLAQSILVVPLRIGGGTRIKILEAMGMARPVVSSRIGAEGLELQDGRHLLLADDAAAFADRTVQLLNDAAGAQRIGRAARERVEQRYGWDRSAARLMDLWAEAAAGSTHPSVARVLQEKAIG
jgi:glycosyltransferase involved in cell wall biosynthesis